MRRVDVLRSALAALSVPLLAMAGVTPPAVAAPTVVEPAPSPTIEDSDPNSPQSPIESGHSDVPEPTESGQTAPTHPEGSGGGSQELQDELTDYLNDADPLPLENQPAPAAMLAGGSGLKPHPSVSFSGRRQIGKGWPSQGVINVGDWDGNGFDDMMIIRGDGTLWFYPAVSDRNFRYPKQIGRGWHNFDLVIGGIDWDGDGRVDLIGRHKDQSLRVYLGNGAGRFKGSRIIGKNWHAMKTLVPMQRSVKGNPGIAAINNNGVLYVYSSNGKGHFSKSTAIGGGWNVMRHVSAAGDWNGSGRTDLLAVDSQGFLRLYQTGGSGIAFSGFQIGKGWGSATHLSVANLTGVRGNIRAVFNDGGLFDYPVKVRSGPKDSIKPGAQMPWSGKGWTHVAPGRANGSGLGPTVNYQVEVEAGLPIYTDVFAHQVHQILNDRRGWRRNFNRVPSGGSMRLILASPTLVDKLCAPLATKGYTSCSIGNYVVINVYRWAYNAEPFAKAGGSLAQYRQYVINHESGHYLGYGHRQCPGAGQLAPVMQQQTLFVKPCRPNGWPNP